MIRIGFPLLGGPLWTGGRNYLLNLVRTLEEHAPGRVAPVLIAAAATADEELEAFRTFGSVEIVQRGFRRSTAPAKLLRSVVLGRDPDLARLASGCGLDLLFENAEYFGRRPPVPVLAWLPDFQHRNVPTMFTRGDWWRREVGFRLQARAPRTIVLSSETSRAECERYYPASRGRTATVRFAIPPRDDLPFDPDAPARYGLPSRFFFLPNQFWRHKNHVSVVEALALLRARGLDVMVAASGNPVDTRHPEHFASIERLRQARGVADLFRVFGMIPYADVLSLMRTCVALVNPSLSEGWSTTVEEAKSLGVPLVLSRLAVHVEQAGEGARYFEPLDPRGIADALEKAWHALPAADGAARAVAARPFAIQRAARYAREFVGAAEIATGSRERVVA